MDIVAVAASVRTGSDLAEVLRLLRRRNARRRDDTPLTYREIATYNGWSHGSVGGYLTGRVLPPTDRFDSLIQLFGVSPAELRALADARDRLEEHSRRQGGDSPIVPRQMPADLAGFSGRHQELAALDAARHAANGPVVVTGTAGVGKTSLAVHWAHRVVAGFPDGQLYLNLRGFSQAAPVQPDEALGALLTALGFTGDRMPEGVDARAGLYRSLLREARVLILLDNATDAEQVRPLLPGAGAARTVVTSRNQLAGLIATAAATPVVLAPLTAPEARRLLAFRLGDDRVESDPEAADAVVAACAGLPLALAVVAGRGALHPRFPLAALARDLFGAGDGPQATWPGPDTTTDVRAVFSGSYRWLSAPTAALFRLLPVAPGMEIDDSAAASLTGDTIAAARRKLAELANANLLTEHRPGWFGTHDLLRAYAADLGATVDDRTQRDAALVRILDHHLFTAAAAAGLLDPHRATYTPPEPRPGVTVTAPADESAARAWFASEQQTLLEAVRLAAATGHDTHAWQLAWALVEFLDRRGHWGDWLAMHTVALGAAERTADPAGIAVTRHQLARACVRLGRYPEAEAHLAEALSGYKKLGDEKGQAWVHGTFSFITDRGERYRDSVEHLQRSLELLRRTGDRAGEGAALSNLGWAYANLGEHDAALENCRQALRLQGEIDDRSGQAYSWDSIGFIHHRLGDHDEADRCYRQALELWRETGDRYNESETLTHLGDLQAVQGNRSAAMDRWESALAILEELGHPDTEAVRRRLGETPPDS